MALKKHFQVKMKAKNYLSFTNINHLSEIFLILSVLIFFFIPDGILSFYSKNIAVYLCSICYFILSLFVKTGRSQLRQRELIFTLGFLSFFCIYFSLTPFSIEDLSRSLKVCLPILIILISSTLNSSSPLRALRKLIMFALVLNIFISLAQLVAPDFRLFKYFALNMSSKHLQNLYYRPIGIFGNPTYAGFVCFSMLISTKESSHLGLQIKILSLLSVVLHSNKVTLALSIVYIFVKLKNEIKKTATIVLKRSNYFLVFSLGIPIIYVMYKFFNLHIIPFLKNLIFSEEIPFTISYRINLLLRLYNEYLFDNIHSLFLGSKYKDLIPTFVDNQPILIALRYGILLSIAFHISVFYLIITNKIVSQFELLLWSVTCLTMLPFYHFKYTFSLLIMTLLSKDPRDSSDLS